MDNKKLTHDVKTKVFEMTLRVGENTVTYEVTVTFTSLPE